MEMNDILSHPKVKHAQELLRADHDRMVEEIVTLTEIPAPPFMEEEKARAYAEMLREAGLEDVQIDGIGNAHGIYRGSGNGAMVAVAAHLDTVFPEGTDVTVRREGTKLFAPGVGDDTRALAVNLSIIRAMKAAGITPQNDILFVGNVGEEGVGDLRGIRYLFNENPLGPQIGSFFTVDGLETPELVDRGVGSYRYRVLFEGPGGHSFGDFGIVNPANALAEFAAGFARIELPDEPKTTLNLSILGGGTSINAIPEQVYVDIDMRSVDPEALDALDAQMRTLVEDALTLENNRNDTSKGEVTARFDVLGNRPAGRTAPEEAIHKASAEAVRAFGFEPAFRVSSTDANIPMSLGVPAICIGSGGTGGRAHTLDEWIDTEPELSLRGIYAVMAAILAMSGLET
ncbi:MAG: M20/M25/M40 family metallo-hydrolase [Rhodobacteraceae bacterium]|nr:M20/M25/M40 family metallo-hydrolase [Paracoccaceae bacterium]MBR9821296.1 M20/M25/M40 family metallo-hydrolase [Paracoccaceae bacterium]